MTVLQANMLVAMLVGFWGRAGDGHPGAEVLAEGLQVLRSLVWFKRAYELQRRPRSAGAT